MRKSKYTDSQIVSILKEAEAGLPVKEVCRKYGISSASYYNWKSKFGGMSASELKRTRELEAENAKLKRMYADLALENTALKDLIEKKPLRPPERRAAVRYLNEVHQLSIRKSCAAIGLSRSAWYRPLVDWLGRDLEVAEALGKLAEEKPGLGFWKLYRRLRRTGHSWNHKRVHRVYCRLRLNLRRRTKKRLPPREPMPLVVPGRPNQVWSADFMSDALYSGLRFRTFNVLDDFNREALRIEIDTSLPSLRLVRVFEQLKEERGLPDVLRTDNGPEFLGEAFVEWCKVNGVLIDYIEPGKPNQNAFIERFNRTYREEVLDTWLFRNLDEVREITWAWMLEYNEERDHDGLNGMTPAEALQQARLSTFELST
ncbi:MAG: IS3 family transposase [Pseudomonadota bacterium]